MTRALGMLLTLLAGHAAAGGLFWTLINVPESNVLMLAASAAIVLLIAGALSWTDATAVLLCDPATPGRRAMRRGLSAWLPFLASVAIGALVWILTERIAEWHAATAGEIDAWWMATTGSTATAWIHGGIRVLLWFARYVLGVSLAVAAFSAGVLRGARRLLSIAWVRAGCSAGQLGTIGLVMVALVWLPLEEVFWRPAALPTAVETVFVGAKLALLYLLINVGWALVLRTGARRVTAASAAPTPS
jgi:hypothetical protein